MIIGFDLDGIFIDAPQFIPKSVLEWLYRGAQKNGPSYRFPSKAEQIVRKMSHFSLFRPKIQKNINYINTLKLKSKSNKLYLISSRYQFLENTTYSLLKKYKLIPCFSSINLNLKNEEPHLFKEKIIKKLKIDFYIDDDFRLLKYLSQNCPETKFFWYNPKGNGQLQGKIIELRALHELQSYLN